MLSDIFEPGHINLDLQSKTKTGVFGELIGTITATNTGFDSRMLLEAVTMRENKMNTIILPGIAIPHGYSNSINGIVGAIGFSRTGIEYENTGKDLVHLFFLLLMDIKSQEQHLHVLSMLMELLSSVEFAKIRESGTPQEMYSLLCRF